MNAATIIAGWKQRLTALAENPEYVFRDTPQHLIEQHYRRLTTFVGYPEPQVSAAEARLGVRFPTVFRQYLLEMAKSPGDLFCGGDLAGIGEFERFRSNALELLAETDPALRSRQFVIWSSLTGRPSDRAKRSFSTCSDRNSGRNLGLSDRIDS